MRPIPTVLLSALVLAAACAPARPMAPPSPTPSVHAAFFAPVFAAVRSSRLSADVRRLADFGTRHTLSDTTSATRGIGAARTWIHDELARISGVDVVYDPHRIPGDGKRLPQDTEIVDVVGTIRGAMPAAASRLYYVVAHYDSRASDVMDAVHDAPGANDDASGVAVLLELARVLSGRRLDATVVFLATAGEEQHLYGAAAHAQSAREKNLDVRAVLNDDIVGDPSDPMGGRHDHAIRVFSNGIPLKATPEEIADIRSLAAESDSPSRELARFVAEVGREERVDLEARLVFRSDRFLRGGDHIAFMEAGFPAAVRFTTVAETFSRQHADVRVENGTRFGDLPEFVDAEYLARVVRLQAAALVHLANAPSSPPHAIMDTSTLTSDTTLRWDASPEPDVVGYEVVWRDTTAAEWQHALDAGNRLEARLAVPKDDNLFAVRAYDRDGWRSPVTFARVR